MHRRFVGSFIQKSVITWGKLRMGAASRQPRLNPTSTTPRPTVAPFRRASPSGPGNGPVTQAHLWPGAVEVVLREGEPRSRVLIEVDAEPR